MILGINKIPLFATAFSMNQVGDRHLTDTTAAAVTYFSPFFLPLAYEVRVSVRVREADSCCRTTDCFGKFSLFSVNYRFKGIQVKKFVPNQVKKLNSIKF